MASKKAAPAEPKPTETTKKVTLYLSKPLATRLRVRAAESEPKMTQSEIAERALEAYLTAKR